MHNTTFKYRIITSKLSLILILISAITGCENQEEKDARRSECLDNYRQQHIQKCEAACEINPVDTYCVMTAGDNIIDSGCASTIKRMVPESNEDTSYQREKNLSLFVKNTHVVVIQWTILIFSRQVFLHVKDSYIHRR